MLNSEILLGEFDKACTEHIKKLFLYFCQIWHILF